MVLPSLTWWTLAPLNVIAGERSLLEAKTSTVLRMLSGFKEVTLEAPGIIVGNFGKKETN
jgi:hypothetical protein